jgi:ATP-dependent Clp protease ATP-binding subunit ClpX
MVGENSSDGAESDLAIATLKQQIAYCSFCSRPQTEVKALVAGPGIFICNKCIRTCSKVVEKASKDDETGVAYVPWGKALLGFPTKSLCSSLASQEKALEHVRLQMQITVEILRSRSVSWAAIGEVLGVSRQAAWERFS